MIFLILAIICSSSLALILKYGSVKKSNILLLINGNYLTASIFALIFIFFKGGFHFSINATLFAIGLGVLFAETFVIYSKAISLAGTALATVSARLSVLIPVLFSILFFNESPNIIMIFGFALAIVTLYLFYLSLKNHGAQEGRKGKYIYLFSLLVGIGFVDFSMKIFEQNFSIDEKGTFVFLIFFFAFLYTLVRIQIGKIKFDKETYKIGLILGLPNVLAIHFLLAALSELPAIIVFPIQNIGVIVLTAVAAYLFWKEQINLYGKIAIAVGIAAILLLKL
ncbi:MAG: EamA family transporter [Ignavibacteriaceae bacterium]|mgnify:FL=1|nr:EamA family transporter [Ignavibacterium sp.]MCC6254667.1 EamA family transporter [Ignavibacteriaceae bacterium]HRN25217.1 EamA family transporter [Ignavibacteriaceae bacterium]HRP94408.1 EamA family transporter [Ignavibacteriaceae bacterium]HRQ52951.1 EamA family transporter [Ignavibacteriaceae bacterium]